MAIDQTEKRRQLARQLVQTAPLLMDTHVRARCAQAEAR